MQDIHVGDIIHLSCNEVMRSTPREERTAETRFDFHDFSQEQCDEKNLIEDEENSITISVEGKLSSRKATGPDNISNKVLNICCDQLAEPLYRLFQLSFEKHSIPSAWKTSCIIPVPKA